MANTRVDYQIFPFGDSVKNPIEETGATKSFHNHGYRSLTLEISGDVTSINLKVEGCINIIDAAGNNLDDNQVYWIGIPLVDATTGGLVNTAEKKGIFRVDITGLSRVRVNIASLSGKATVVGVATRYPIQNIGGQPVPPTPVDPEAPVADEGQVDHMILGA